MMPRLSLMLILMLMLIPPRLLLGTELGEGEMRDERRATSDDHDTIWA
jgi:hypothetical protein